ncbi:DegT/DnrJ/EryC1/StrS family aminotransferase [Actinomyces succiniciruminis]|uniref:DegT/DnrJ/EryC1/StrS family aminotransferase n=1 Tax=Actinomyces succiniciruminis TaxID=1522002 RepID=UPI001B32E840|nr:DegT/DnrJ/EryC1/StrS family aminotransferase [Actinomyces succiniciruminis]
MRYLYSGDGWDVESLVDAVRARHADGRGSGLGSDALRLAEEKAARELVMEPASVVMTSSGTGALTAAVCAITEKQGAGEVLVPAFGWTSVASVFLVMGWSVRVVDVGRHSLVPGAAEYLRAMTEKTSALVVTHMRGMPNPDLSGVRQICDERSLLLIEDCAQAWGVTVSSRKVGTFGDFSVFSSQENKLISTGEGGICVSERKEWSSLVRRVCGYRSERKATTLNLRMSDMQAEIFVRELGALDSRIFRLRELQNLIRREFDAYLETRGRKREILGSYEGSNGQAVCVLPAGKKDMELLRSKLRKYQVRHYTPCMEGDPHQARHWVAADKPLAGLDSISNYVDIPIPLVSNIGERDYYVACVRNAIWEVLRDDGAWD